MGAVTHAFDMDQRICFPSFQAGVGQLSIVMPASGNLAPPGPYMLFILNGNNVPSVAKIIQLS